MSAPQEPTAASRPRPMVASAARGRPRGVTSYTARLGPLVTTVFLFVALSLVAPPFLNQRNLLNVLEQSTGLGIIAVAGTFVLVAGGFDLSVGAVFALSGVVAALTANGASSGLGLVLGPLAGVLVGIVNGLLVTGMRINPFIATLATAIVVRGVALRASGGFLVNVRDESFRALGRGDLLGVKYSIWVWLVFALVMGFVLWRTAFGRYVYATGGNEEAARLSGVQTGQVRTLTFLLSGFAAGLAGALSASRIGTGQADAGLGLELTAVAAVVVGGTSLRGGEGAVWRAMVGVLLLGLIGNGFNLLGIDPVYQNMVFGGIILVAAAVDARLRGTTA